LALILVEVLQLLGSQVRVARVRAVELPTVVDQDIKLLIVLDLGTDMVIIIDKFVHSNFIPIFRGFSS
jgi:hypothetical protein